MKKSLTALTLLLALSACDQQQTSPAKPAGQPGQLTAKTENNQDQNDIFSQFAADFITAFWQHNPGYGVYVGYYQHDAILPVPNAETRAKNLAFAKTQLAQLQAIDVSRLNPPRSATDRGRLVRPGHWATRILHRVLEEPLVQVFAWIHQLPDSVTRFRLQCPPGLSAGGAMGIDHLLSFMR